MLWNSALCVESTQVRNCQGSTVVQSLAHTEMARVRPRLGTNALVNYERLI